MPKRFNNACKFFPCHRGLEDCTFCYCPLYPCLDTSKGEYVYSLKFKRNIWSCVDCSWIHKKKIVDNFLNSIVKNILNSKTELDLALAKKIKRTGIVLICHGSKLSKANNFIYKIIRIIKRNLPNVLMGVAYLQFSPPDLSESIKNLIKMGSKKIVVVPLFLFNGNHVSRDIPRAIKKEIANYPDVKFIYTRNLGEDTKIGEIVIERIKDALACK